jgi:hypothetical protein
VGSIGASSATPSASFRCDATGGRKAARLRRQATDWNEGLSDRVRGERELFKRDSPEERETAGRPGEKERDELLAVELKARDLLKAALEPEEDAVLARFAEERERSFDRKKALTHAEAWAYLRRSRR